MPELVSARHILLAVNQNASAPDKEVVRKRAQGLFAQLKGKADWATICKNNSDDVDNKNTGGNLGYFTRKMMPAAISDAVFAAKEGEIVGPVASELGFHILRVDKKVASHPLTLAEVQKDEEVKFQVRLEKIQQRLDALVADLKAKAKIQRT